MINAEPLFDKAMDPYRSRTERHVRALAKACREIHGRYRGDTREICGRYGGDIDLAQRAAEQAERGVVQQRGRYVIRTG